VDIPEGLSRRQPGLCLKVPFTSSARVFGLACCISTFKREGGVLETRLTKIKDIEINTQAVLGVLIRAGNFPAGVEPEKKNGLYTR